MYLCKRTVLPTALLENKQNTGKEKYLRAEVSMESAQNKDQIILWALLILIQMWFKNLMKELWRQHLLLLKCVQKMDLLVQTLQTLRAREFIHLMLGMSLPLLIKDSNRLNQSQRKKRVDFSAGLGLKNDWKRENK